MKIFVIGDYKSGTGPANATKSLIEAMEEPMVQKYTGKLMRLLELYAKIPSCDVCLLSGHSKQNLYAIRLAKKYNKPVLFWMHGCVEHENDINGVPDQDMNLVERQVLEGSDRILGVSKTFETWLKENYPEYSHKIYHLSNGVKKRDIKEEAERVESPYVIITVGGGMIRKRIERVCRAVEKLVKSGEKISLIVIGAKGPDTELIGSYPFVHDMGLVNSHKAAELMRSARLCIQNSCFETFGLAPIEALESGCSILVSGCIGALEVFDEGAVLDEDIIKDCEDPLEIADKIAALMKKPNHDRLSEAINYKEHSWETVAEKLEEICEDEIHKRTV